MSRSKDQERFPRLKAQNGRYKGFSGSNVHVEKPADELKSVVCSVCDRKWNVSVSTLPDELADFGSLGCQELQAVAVSM